MSFFPEGVQVETVSKYTKLNQGTTTLRILSEPFAYLETWIETESGRVPKRFEIGADVPSEELGPDGLKPVVAYAVYNYSEKAVQIWTVSQKSILKRIKAYTENEKYGESSKYDINIERTGEGKKTRYSVIADPVEKASKEVLDAYDAVSIDLEALLINADPFIS